MIVGKKIENSYVFSLDGQNLNHEESNLQVLKLVQPKPQNKTSKQNNQNQITKKPLNNSRTKEPSLKDKSQSAHQLKQRQERNSSSSETDISSDFDESETRINQPVSQLLEQIRPQRVFKPLSEQFPNILRHMDYSQNISGDFDKKEKKITQKIERQLQKNSDDESSDEQSGDEQNEFLEKALKNQINDVQQQHNLTQNTEADEVEEHPQNPPKPEKQPQSPQKNENQITTRKGNKSNKENKAQQINQRKKVDPFKGQYEQKRKEKLQNRDKVKHYGKQQIVRAHTFRNVFEHKQSWGADQKMKEKLEEKKKSVQKDVEKQRKEKKKYMEKRQQERENISNLFPEKRESRFKKIWEQEARSASRKQQEIKDVSMEPKQEERKKTKSLPPERIQAINRLVQQNAQRKPEIAVQEMQKKLEILHRKAQTKITELKQKEILQKCKKVPFIPPWFGFDMDDSKTDTKSIKSIKKSKKSDLSSEINDVSETNAPLSQIDNGIIVSKQQFDKIQRNVQKKKKKIEKINKSLSNNEIKTNKKIKYTSEELMIKDQIRQDALLESKILKEKQKLLQKTGMKITLENEYEKIDPADLGIRILEDANLPQMKIPIEDEQRLQNKLKHVQPNEQLIKNFDPERDLSYKDQVEEEIRRQIKSQKSKPAQKQSKYDKPKKTLVPLSNQKPAKSKLIDNLSQSRSKEPESSKKRMSSYKREILSGQSQGDMIIERSKKPTKTQLSDKKFKTSQISEIKSRIGDIQFLDQVDQSKEEGRPLDFDEIFEKDIEEAVQKIDLDSIWKSSQFKKPFKNDSDDEDDDEFISIVKKEKDLIDNYYENPKIKEMINPTKAKEKQMKKSVQFVQQTSEANPFIEQLKQGKRELETLVLVQKLAHPNEQNETVNEDKTNILRFSKQMFQSNNPFPSDILGLSAKELMNLPELYL